MTTLQAKQICERYLYGDRIKAIAEEFGVSRSTVYYYTKNVRTKNRKSGLIESVASEYLSGRLTKEEVCKKYGICLSTFYSYLRVFASRK